MIGDAIAHAIVATIVVVAIITAIITTALIFGIPWLWGILKPFLHMVTA